MFYETTDLELEQAHDRMDGVMRAINHTFLTHQSFMEYTRFIESLKTKDNRAIEGTLAMRLLKQLLSDQNSELVQTIPSTKLLYRARKVDEPDLNGPDAECFIEYSKQGIRLKGFDKYGSKEPPLGSSSSQRNNYEGASYLYLAEDEYTACAEVRPFVSGIVSLATFRVKQPMKVFDFTNASAIEKKLALSNSQVDIPLLITKMLFQFSKPTINEKEYYPSQYLSDYIRKYGFDGIKYRSMNSLGHCYTIFNCCENNIIFDSSELVLSRAPQYIIYRLNKYEKIGMPKDFATYCDVSEEVHGEIKDRIISSIRQPSMGKRNEKT